MCQVPVEWSRPTFSTTLYRKAPEHQPPETPANLGAETGHCPELGLGDRRWWWGVGSVVFFEAGLYCAVVDVE